MTTLAKIGANRRNGHLSTGPRTFEGKAIVARNAVKDGIFANVPVVAGERSEAWGTHRAGVIESLAPVGLLEMNLAERVALLLWRLQRLARYEATTTGAAVEDAGLPPPGIDPFMNPMTRTGSNSEADLKWLASEFRASREVLAVFAEAAVLVRRLGLGGADPVPGELVQLVLGWASGLTDACPTRKYDPVSPADEAFLPALGLPAGPVRKAAWTADLLLRAIAYLADAIGQPVDEFLRVAGRARQTGRGLRP